MDIPTGKKIENLLNKLKIKELSIKNERELELVAWGILCGRWHDQIKWKKEVSNRICDIKLGNIAVELKYITSIADKDRCVGQTLDYLKTSEEVVIIAIDHKNYLENVFTDNKRVFVVVF